jgi:hypothetical protein
LEIDKEQYDSMARVSTSTGTPRYFYPSHQDGKFYFYPAPDQAYNYNLGYFYLPTIPTHTTSAADSDNPVWKEDVDILIQYIQAKAMEYNDDARAEKSMSNVKGMIVDSKLNSFDKRAGFNRTKLGKSFKKRF